MKPIGACIFVVPFLMIFASLVRFYVFVMPPGGSKMLVVDVSIGLYQWLGRSPSHHEVLTLVQLLLRLQNHHHHTQSATTTTTTPQTSLAMDQEEKKQVQSIRDQLKGHSLPDGGEIVESINSSSSEFNATNNRPHIVWQYLFVLFLISIVRQYESGSTASERKTTRETPDRKGLTFSLFSLEDLLQYFVRELKHVVSVCIQLYFGFVTFLSKLFCFCSLCSNGPPPPFAQYPYPFQFPYPFPYQYPYPRDIRSVNLRQHFGLKRKDVAALYGVSVSKFKRVCRQQGIEQWRNRMGSSGSVSKPPDQHGERNTSTAHETPSHNVQTGMEGELFGQKEVANVFRQDFMGGPIALNTSTARETPSHNVQTRMEGEPVGQNQESNECRRDFMERQIALNTESGLIMVSRPPDQHGERNTSTACETPSHNVQTGMEGELFGQNEVANAFRRDFMGGPIALNTENGLIMDERRPPDQHGGNNPSPTCRTMATNGLTEMQIEMVGLELNELFLNFVEDPEGWNTEIGSIAEMSSDGDVFYALEEESTPCQHPMPTIPDMMPHLSCSEPAPFPQPMPTVPRTTGSLDDLRNLLPSPEESFLAGDAFGSINRTVPSCSYPVSSQTMSTVPHTTESLDDLRNLLALEKEPLWARHVSESINLPVASCFDPTPSQSMPTILHTMPTNPGMMSLLTERQDTMSVNLKATYEGTTIKFQFPLTSGINELKEEVSKTLECELGSFRVEYVDEEGEWILMARDENVREYLRLVISLGNQVTKLKVYKVPNTTNLL